MQKVSCNYGKNSRRLMLWRRAAVAIALVSDISLAGETAGQDSALEQGDVPWYDFHGSWELPVPEPVAMNKRVLDAPAGKHGRVRATGGQLEFENGTPARFWGVGISFSNRATPSSVLPPKTAALALARKIASYGFNHVRFGGFDGTASRAILNWRASGKLESRMLDRLDYFIAQLRKLGIYYSFSINNNSHKLFEDAGLIEPNTSEKYAFSRFRTVRLFDEKAQDRIAAWTQAFFRHRNPFTGLTYAEDPANIYFSAVNEDTASLAFYSRLRRFDDAWQEHIKSLFSDFLSERYTTREDLVAAWEQTGRIGLLPWEDQLASRMSFRPAVGMLRPSDARLRDTGRFLLAVDRSLAGKISDALKDANYTGLFTGGNKWYGYGNLYASYLEGNYIEGHLYLGSIVPGKREKGITVINNLSYLQEPTEGGNPVNSHLTDRGSHLARILPTHLIDRPYIISEWNHYAWSDYAYEGPFILMSFAARTGIDGLDLHTYFDNPRQYSYKANIPQHAFTVAGNPLYLGILPTLSLAFIRGDIEEAVPKQVVCVARDEVAVLDIALKLPVVPPEVLKAVSRYGPEYIKVALGEGCSGLPDKQRTSKQTKPERSPVRWMQAPSGDGRMLIDTQRFAAIVGDLKDAAVGKDFLSTRLTWSGGVSAISLDGKPLNQSACTLVTVAGPVRNQGAKWQYKDGTKIIKDAGTGTPQMRGNSGTVRISFTRKNITAAYAIGVDGQYIPASIQKREVGDGLQFVIDVDSVATPWFVFGSSSCVEKRDSAQLQAIING